MLIEFCVNSLFFIGLLVSLCEKKKIINKRWYSIL